MVADVIVLWLQVPSPNQTCHGDPGDQALWAEPTSPTPKPPGSASWTVWSMDSYLPLNMNGRGPKHCPLGQWGKGKVQKELLFELQSPGKITLGLDFIGKYQGLKFYSGNTMPGQWKWGERMGSKCLLMSYCAVQIIKRCSHCTIGVPVRPH